MLDLQRRSGTKNTAHDLTILVILYMVGTITVCVRAGKTCAFAFVCMPALFILNFFNMFIVIMEIINILCDSKRDCQILFIERSGVYYFPALKSILSHQDRCDGIHFIIKNGAIYIWENQK